MAEIKEVSSPAERIEKLEAENMLLLEQLSRVQEKYEDLFRVKQEDNTVKRNIVPAGSPSTIFDGDILRHPFVEQLLSLHKMENEASKQAAFEFQLGSLITRAFSSPISFVGLPVSLCRLLWPNTSALGNNFSKIIEIHKKGGEQEVDKKLARMHPKSRAGAYAAIARQLMENDKVNAARYAQKAWQAEPTASRLKWLAFRTNDAGNPLLSYIMLTFLPVDTSFSVSEKRAAEAIEKKAREILTSAAKSSPGKASKAASDKSKVEAEKSGSYIDKNFHERLSAAFQTVVLEFGKDRKDFESLMRAILAPKKN